MLKKITTTAAFLSAAITAIPAANAISFTDPVDGKFDMGDYLAENAYGFLPVPIIITEPAVGYGGGAMGIFLHESESEKQQRKQLAQQSLDGGAQLIPPAVTVVGAAGTQNGTWLAFAAHRRTWNKDKIRYLGAVGYGNAKLDIYDTLSLGGNDVELAFDTESTGLVVLQKAEFRVGDSPLLLGVKQFFSRSTIESSNHLADKLLTGFMGKETNMSSLGLLAKYETIDNLFFPRNGFVVNAEYDLYREAIGSDYEYDQFKLEGQGYIPINNKWTVAVAGDYQSLKTDEWFLPPLSKPYIDLRGASAFRYQGDEVTTLQGQLMYHLDNRWTLSGFYGAGKATDNGILKNPLTKSESTVDAYGVGFRYQIARRYGIHMGVDVAFSEGDSALYFQVGSGF
ncbi:BamA/TamA family outer membrane protein [Photobacterium rosenbergii]|uniref:BamA/TamA family outer membrane protein n=1 Tax=Photobacterium rosenbergii TaxID=294936 RepID=UPI001C997110|nr:BamA/TamA family outer membrane protein [Photobacterium rosenbergii]MBY5947786.1 BamA/TamA family outer membrane protein [Photobacterium rosenbergii]